MVQREHRVSLLQPTTAADSFTLGVERLAWSARKDSAAKAPFAFVVCLIIFFLLLLLLFLQCVWCLFILSQHPVAPKAIC